MYTLVCAVTADAALMTISTKSKYIRFIVFLVKRLHNESLALSLLLREGEAFF